MMWYILVGYLVLSVVVIVACLTAPIREDFD